MEGDGGGGRAEFSDCCFFFLAAGRWCGEARMTAKRSQMWPAGRRRGWQRLGVARRGGRAAGPGPRESPGAQGASRSRSERAAAGRAGQWVPGLVVRLGDWLVGGGAGWGEGGGGGARGKGGPQAHRARAPGLAPRGGEVRARAAPGAPGGGRRARRTYALGIRKVCSRLRAPGLGSGAMAGSFTLRPSVAERRLRNVCLAYIYNF